MKNVLVFPCGSEIGLEIYKSVSKSIHFNLIGASSMEDHGSFVYENYVPDLPMVDDAGFIEKINRVIEEHDIDYIFPAHDSVVLKLAQAQAAGGLKCEVITSPAKTCEIARSKKKTYDYFRDVIDTPDIYEKATLTAEMLPLFLKPDVGQGSKGTYRANTLEDVAFYTAKDDSLLLLEYLPGKEYTIDCFTSAEGQLLFCEGRQRTRIMNGISVRSETVKDERFQEIAERLNGKIDFRGVWFFQVKEDEDGKFKLMEIAPRIAGTMGLVRCKGVNLALMSLYQAEGIPVTTLENENTVIIDRALANRYRHDISYENVYIDLDDLLLTDGKVNVTAAGFVYQCINRGIKVRLLTRHHKGLEETLKQHRLGGLFDEVIWVQDDTEKHAYIKESNAIFIDDSFSERKKVMEALNIPTFDCHMLESLMEN